MVAIMAILIPIMPYQLPRFDVSWLLKPERLKMNKTAAAIYDAVITPEEIVLSSFF